MASRDVWNTWHEGLRSPQNPTAKPEGFVATGSPRAMYFTHHGKPWLKPIIARPLGKTWYKNCSYCTQMKSTTTAIDDSNRRQNKLGLGCSREATVPLILIFELLFLWLNIGWHFKWITQFHNCHSPKHTSKKILHGNQYLSQNMYKNNNVDLHFYRHRRSFICRESSLEGTHVHFAVVPYTPLLGKEVKWDLEITTTWLTSGGNVFDCIKGHQKWQF